MTPINVPKKITRLTELPIVEVEWRDACTDGGWMNFDELKEHIPLTCRTVGRLVRFDKQQLTVLPTICTNGKSSVPWAIPREWVQHVTLLRKGKKNASGK